MTQPFLPTRNSALRVFSASLLSALLVMMPFVQIAVAARGSARPVKATARKDANAGVENRAVNPSLPGPVPVPLVPTITATMTDALINDDADTKADPTNGVPLTTEKIEYTVTISNSGTDATNVTYTNTIDAHTTLGSVTTQPIAVNDSFNVLGNVRIQVPDGGSDLLGNDCDPDPLGGPCTNAGLTISTLAGDNSAPFAGTSTQGGNVTAATTDGSFQYNPAPGFTGTDTFTYTVTDATNKTDTATVTLTVGNGTGTPGTNVIWFVNAAAGAGGDGRLTSPFNCLTGAGCFDTVAADDPGDSIFLYSGTYADTAALTLLNNQKLIGAGATASLAAITGVTVPAHSDALPATNSNPTTVTITSTASGIVLGSDNTLRGFTVGNTSIAAGNYDIRNTTTATVGTLAISDVVLNGTGGLFRADSGGALTITFDSASTTGAGNDGFAIGTASGSVIVSGSGTISGVAGTDVAINAGTVSFSCSSNITHTSASAMVSVSGGHTTGTITFTGTLNATNGSGLQFNNADSTTSYNFNGTTTLNGGDAGIDIIGSSGGTFSFNSNTSINNPSGIAYNEDTSTANVTYSGTITKTNNAFNAVNINAKSAGTTAFGGAISASTTTANAIDLTNTGGTVNFTGGLSITTSSGVGFNATGAGAAVNVTGTNTVTNTTGAAVNIVDTIIGASNVTFLSINHNGANTAIILDDTGSGTFTVTGTGTTDGTGGTIENITASDAITLNNTDGLVTLKNMIIEDIGSTAGGFNTISNQDGIHGQQVDGGMTLDNMTIRRISDNAINGSTLAGNATTTWNGLTINNSLIENSNRFHVASVGDANNEGMVRILGITGTVNITNNIMQDGAEMLDLFPTSGTMTLTVTNNNFHRAYKEFTSGTTASVGGHCIDVTVQNAANANVNVGHRTDNALDNDFLNCRLGSIRVANDAGATGNVDVMIGQNEFTVNDHSSGITGDFDFPQGGVLIMARGTNTATFEVVLDSNYFDEITNASGGVGQFSLDMDGGQWEVIAEENTFDTPGNAPWYVRADNAGNAGTMNSSILFQNNNYIRGAFCSPDPAAAGGGCNLGGGELCGGQGYCGPGLRSLVQVQNGANINFTMNSDDLKHHDTGFDPGNTVEVQQLNVPAGGNNGTVCTNFTNNTAADGYSLEHFNTAVGTFNLQKGASNTGPCVNCSVAQIQDVFDDNGNTGGANNPATDPPTVSVPFLGVNVIAGTCTQPSIPFGPEEFSESAVSQSSKSLEPEPETLAAPRDFKQLEELLWVAPPANFDAPDGFAEWRMRRLGPKPAALEQAPQNPVPQNPVTPLSQNPVTFGAPLIQSLIYVPIINLSQAIADSEDKESKTKKEASKDETKEEPKVEPIQDELLKVEPVKAEPAKVEPAKVEPAKVEPAKEEPVKTDVRPTNSADSESATKPNKGTPKTISKVRGQKSKVRSQRSKAKRHHAKSSGALPATMSGETLTIIIGTLRAGDSVTITYQVTVNNPPNLTLLNPARVTNQGTVTADGGVNVLTDDTAVIGAANPTVTEVDLFDVNNVLGSIPNPSNDGDQVTFTATITENPAQGSTDPTGTVDFIDTSNGNAVICNDVAISGPAGGPYTAICQVSNLSAGSTHNIRADYSGDGNFDPMQSNLVAQVVNPCVPNPVVTSTANSGANTLREALTNVCSAPNNNITFNLGAGPQTITVLSTLVIARNLNITNTVTGTNGPLTVSAGGGNFGVFRVQSPLASASMSGFTITGANASGVSGGGLEVQSGTVTLTSMLFTGNTVINGDGGGIAAFGSSTVNIRNSTISGNTARHGGGLASSGGTLNLLNVTVTNNNANGNTGTGACPAAGSVNGAGGGIETGGNPTTITNSIVALNTACDAGAINTSGAFTGSNNLVAGDPLIGALADNGGSTQTHALLANSPAIEGGDNTATTTAGLTTDQRGTGYPRIADSADAGTTATVDIGSYELHPTIENIADKSTAEDTGFNFNFNIGDDTGALITMVTATSGNTTLVPNANLIVTGSGGTRNLAITPAADANSPADGTATITVTVTATNGQTAVDTFVVTVTEVNDAPVPTNDTIADVAEDSGTYVIPFTTLLLNDTNKGAANESGQTVDITAVSSPTGGTVVINGTNVEFTPTANFFGAAGFTYTVTDNGTTNTASDPKTGNATVSFNVTAVNDPPSFTKGADPTVDEDAGAQTIVGWATSISQGAGGETGQTLTFNITPAGTTGNISLASGPAINSTTGTLTFTTNADTNGTATFDVTLSDNGSNVPPNSNTSGTQSFTITVNAVNDAPTFQIPSNPAAVDEDAGLITVPGFTTNFVPGPVTATDEGTQTLVGYTVTSAGAPTGNLAFTSGPSIDNAGTLTYTATANTNGSATFNVVATDSGSGTAPNVNQSAPVQFTINVNAVNDEPSFTAGPNQVVGISAGAQTVPGWATNIMAGPAAATDETGQSLTFTVTVQSTTNTLTFVTPPAINSSGQLTYHATNGTSGVATVDVFLTDGGSGVSPNDNTSPTQTFTITVGLASVSVQDAVASEPSTGTANMVFTVTLNAPAPGAVSVNFTTADEPAGPGKAVAGVCGSGGDYTTSSGTINFTAGQQVKTISVAVCSDAITEGSETFLVNLSSPVNATIGDGTATGTITEGVTAGTLLISEFRQFGPGPGNDPLDDFVEIYNNTNSPITVPAGGYGLFRMPSTCAATDQPQLIGTIPAGVIPARGHFLFTGPIANYSLKDYGGTNAAVNNALLTADLGANENFGLFATADVSQISSVNRFDAVGFGINNQNACDLLREGTLLPALTVSPTLGQHSYFRKMCDWIQGSGCTVVPPGTKDTNQNADDFWLADTAGSAITGRLGAPGPENLGSPIRRDNANNPGSGGIDVFLLDDTVGSSAHPNRNRNGGDPEGSFGSMTLRYRVTNNTGANVTRLRYRVVDISTAIQPTGPTADLRALTVLAQMVNPVNDQVTCTAVGAGMAPCTVFVTGTNLETPPAQAIGGGYNSTLSSGTVTSGTPIPPGGSILINFKLGVEKTGQFRFYIIVEALP